MKMQDIRKLKPAELETKLIDTRKELAEAKRSHAAGELINPRVITSARRDIARLHTLLNAKPVNQEKKDA